MSTAASSLTIRVGDTAIEITGRELTFNVVHLGTESATEAAPPLLLVKNSTTGETSQVLLTSEVPLTSQVPSTSQVPVACAPESGAGAGAVPLAVSGGVATALASSPPPPPPPPGRDGGDNLVAHGVTSSAGRAISAVVIPSKPVVSLAPVVGGVAPTAHPPPPGRTITDDHNVTSGTRRPVSAVIIPSKPITSVTRALGSATLPPPPGRTNSSNLVTHNIASNSVQPLLSAPPSHHTVCLIPAQEGPGSVAPVALLPAPAAPSQSVGSASSLPVAVASGSRPALSMASSSSVSGQPPGQGVAATTPTVNGSTLVFLPSLSTLLRSQSVHRRILPKSIGEVSSVGAKVVATEAGVTGGFPTSPSALRLSSDSGGGGGGDRSCVPGLIYCGSSPSLNNTQCHANGDTGIMDTVSQEDSKQENVQENAAATPHYSLLEPPGLSLKERAPRPPRTCLLCNKSFSSNGALSRHNRTHSGEKPFSCNICNKTFTQSYSLSVHLRTHTGERPYKCDICGKTFGIVGHLSRHRRIHSKDFPCSVCDKTFTSCRYLNKHLRTHSDELSLHSCGACDKTFVCAESLMAHQCTRASDATTPSDCESEGMDTASLEPTPPCDNSNLQKLSLVSFYSDAAGEVPLPVYGGEGSHILTDTGC